MSVLAEAYVATLRPILTLASEYAVAEALAILAELPDHLVERPIRQIAAQAQRNRSR